MPCALVVILVFPVLAATVIYRRIVGHLKEKGNGWATPIGVLGFAVSLIAVFMLAVYIISTKFRFLR